MNSQNKRRKKKTTKAKLKRGLKGSIAIFLCLLITPFLSIALSLVEYSRYQEVKEVTDEIYELTGVSVLSDYDSYIHDRFGLLCTSQEGSLEDSSVALLEENIKLLGSQISLDESSASVNGQFALTNVETLRKQVVDFSELTATTAVLAKDFKLEDLLNQLQGVSQFQDIMNTVDSLANTADALNTAVTSLETLKTELTELQTAVNDATTTADTLATEMAELYKKLGENGITLPENATLGQIESAVSSFSSTYLEDLKNLYRTGNLLVEDLNSIKANLGEVKTAATEFAQAVEDAQQALEDIASTNSADESGQVSAAATSTLSDVLEEMVDLVNDTLADIKQETIDTAKGVVDDILEEIINSTGLAGITTRYEEIVNGNYFALPLTDTAKQDLTDLLKTAQEVYSNQSSDAIATYFKDKFIPQINIDLENIISAVEGVISDASTELSDSVTNNVITLLTKLVNIVKGLFDLDLFYEADLNAYVNSGGASDSPYQAFLDALGRMFTAVENLKTAMQEDDLFSKLLDGLSAMGDMFGAIGDLLGAIWNIAGASVQGIMELASSTISGDVQGLYEKLLITGYMRHNLPCRVNSSTYKTEGEGSDTAIKVSLTGEGLTGFQYDNIARPVAYSGQSASVTAIEGGSKFQGLQTTIDNLQNGYGSDTMFKGAELEYIRAGTNSEIANQVFVFFDLYFLRLLLDIPSIFMDGEVGAVATAATVASWVVYILYIVVEPFCDTVLLVNGESVPLIRTDCWLTATGVANFIGKLGNAVLGEALKTEIENYANTNATDGSSSSGNNASAVTGGSGLANTDYQTHLLIILLAFVDSDTMISRLQDIIELEASEYYRQNGGSFKINKTYTVVEIAGDVDFKPFLDIGVSFTKYRVKQSVSY